VPKLQDAAADTGSAYEKITMTEAVRRALARNVTTLVALAEIDRAQALLGEARAPSMPSLIGALRTRGSTGIGFCNLRPTISRSRIPHLSFRARPSSSPRRTRNRRTSP